MSSTGVLDPSNYPDHFQTEGFRFLTLTDVDDTEVFYVPLFFAPPAPTDGKVKRYRWWDQVLVHFSTTAGTTGALTGQVVEVTLGDAFVGFTSPQTGHTEVVHSAATALTENAHTTISPTGTAVDGNRVTPGKLLALKVAGGALTSNAAIEMQVQFAHRTRPQ